MLNFNTRIDMKSDNLTKNLVRAKKINKTGFIALQFRKKNKENRLLHVHLGCPYFDKQKNRTLDTLTNKESSSFPSIERNVKEKCKNINKSIDPFIYSFILFITDNCFYK